MLDISKCKHFTRKIKKNSWFPAFPAVLCSFLPSVLFVIQLNRTLVRSLQDSLLQPKVRLLHSKFRSVYQISYFAPSISYFAPYFSVKYYLPLIFIGDDVS